MKESLVFRSMNYRDLEAVLAIEEHAFPMPWSKNAFLMELRHNPMAFYLVACQGETLAAYLGSWFLLTDAHITNLAVHPAFRRKGLATHFLEYFLSQAIGQGIRRISLEVRQRNMGAQRLYRSLGFVQVGTRERYYHDNQEDALILGLEVR